MRAPLGSALSLFFLLGAAWMGQQVLGREFLSKSAPVFGPHELLRDFLLFLSACWLVWGSWAHRSLPAEPERLPKRLSYAVRALLFAAVGLFLLSPRTFKAIAYEDSVVEIVSELALLVGFLLGLRAVRNLRQAGHAYLSRSVGVAITLTALCFLILMEEISWTHTLFQFQVPEFFATHNQQRETNLHNFFTTEFEHVYLMGGTVLFVLVPFLLDRDPPPVNPELRRLLPTRELMYLACVQVSFNFDMWNTLFIPWEFWLTVLILGVYVYQGQRCAGVALALTVGCQLVFLAFPDHHHSIQRITEYREAAIALSLGVYAYGLYLETRPST